jgi:N-methylhydantoinase B
VTLSSDRSRNAPWGLQGGHDGKTATNYRVQPGGRRVALPSKVNCRTVEGERIVIETPGGGGYGRPSLRDRSRLERDLLDGIVSTEYVSREHPEARLAGGQDHGHR